MSASVSPSSSNFVFPPSPTKHSYSHKPNPHPYAIKTTSTGVLSRSNSGHISQVSRSHYVPASPSRSRSPTRSPDQFRGHRYSRSFKSDLPSPLPSPSLSPTQSHMRSNGPSSTGLSAKDFEELDLPGNPKSWTPAQLGIYLSTVLQARMSVQSSEAQLPPRVADDIVKFVREKSISGKWFLRLSETDLEEMGVNQFWRTALLHASRSLRQNIPQGRIWGFGSGDAHQSAPGSPTKPFSSELYNSSSSSVDLSTPPIITLPPVKRRHGHGNGRVKGLVETWERSSSFSSSASENDIDIDRTSGSWFDAQNESAVADEPRSVESESPYPASSSTSDIEYVTAPSASESDVTDAETVTSRHGTEEPTVEELLEQERQKPGSSSSWGARAWEEMDDVPGVTVKRIPSSEPEDAAQTNDEDEFVQRGRVLQSAKKLSKGRRPKDERRVVTAIFSPGAEQVAEPTDVVAEQKEDVVDHGLDQLVTLRDKVTLTHHLLIMFKQRLEIAEQKIAAMEQRQVDEDAEHHAEATRRLEWERTHLQARERELEQALVQLAAERERNEQLAAAATAARLRLSRPFTLLSHAWAWISPKPYQPSVELLSRPKRHAGDVRFEDDDNAVEMEPQSVRAIPSYVLLVGFGVCVVVLKVMLRRMAAGRVLRRP